MNLQNRFSLLENLGHHILNKVDEWEQTIQKAYQKNTWFTPEFIELSARHIATHYLQKDALEKWANSYSITNDITQKKVGIVMAGNIPLVGFHDFLCAFISGHKQVIKLSSKDDVLLPYLMQQMILENKDVENEVIFADRLSGLDAYIATGSNNSSRYFEQYFGKYPHIIRCNRTSVAILKGDENKGELEKLSDDIHLYFGLGCRNVTKIYVPEEYDFVPLIKAMDKYKYFEDHHKYKNNFDYQLSLLLLNHQFYMTNGCTLLTENKNVFSPISTVHYEYYWDAGLLTKQLEENGDLQSIIGKDFIPFGQAQQPGLTQYADGVDTMDFLVHLSQVRKSY
ncbi:MAG: acyl-CoA reductase [Niastella sp.]|nr:acyl-CoA reductase [Niastella sp.]